MYAEENYIKRYILQADIPLSRAENNIIFFIQSQSHTWDKNLLFQNYTGVLYLYSKDVTQH